MRQGIDERQRNLALPHVVARRLARRVLQVIVENIVAQLKTPSHQLSKLRHHRHGIPTAARQLAAQQRTRVGAGLKQAARLLVYHPKIILLAEVRHFRQVQLQQLAVRQLLAQQCHPPHHLHASAPRGMHHRFRQQVVAHQHRPLVVHQRIHALLPPAAVALVNNIVMHQTRRVEQFQSHCRVQHILAHAASIARRQQREHGPHALALTLRQMGQRQLQQGVVAPERTAEQGLITNQVLLNRAAYDAEHVHRISFFKIQKYRKIPTHIAFFP